MERSEQPPRGARTVALSVIARCCRIASDLTAHGSITGSNEPARSPASPRCSDLGRKSTWCSDLRLGSDPSHARHRGQTPVMGRIKVGGVGVGLRADVTLHQRHTLDISNASHYNPSYAPPWGRTARGGGWHARTSGCGIRDTGRHDRNGRASLGLRGSDGCSTSRAGDRAHRRIAVIRPVQAGARRGGGTDLAAGASAPPVAGARHGEPATPHSSASGARRSQASVGRQPLGRWRARAAHGRASHGHRVHRWRSARRD